MPLPENGTPWPPAAGTPQGTAVQEWSAWYSGDPDQLQAFYGPVSAAHRTSSRPSQYAGGVVGRIARWWWGQPTPEGEQRAKLHVPLAADIAGTSADLLFSEPVKLKADSDTMTEFMEALQDDGLDSRLHESAEVQAALGGVYLRATWDSELQPTPWSTAIHPDGAVPEFRHGKLRAVNLWTVVASRDGKVLRHVERHEPGWIVHRLYEGTATNLGRVVPLTESTATVDLAQLVNDEGAQETGSQRLTCTYVPNMLPNRLDRHSPQGRSDFQGVTPLFDALDEAYSSWWRDIRQAKGRIHAPSAYLESDGPGQGATMDLDREVYVPLDGALPKPGDRLQLQVTQFAIRVAEHAQTCKEWTERAIESAGYSTQSLSSGTGGAVTAAEVHAHERRSYMTRGKKVRYWKAALREHLLALADVANHNLGAHVDVQPVDVDFADGVQESAQSLANTASLLRNAEAASVQTRVQMVHPDWDDKQVTAEAERILAETGSGASFVPPDAGL